MTATLMFITDSVVQRALPFPLNQKELEFSSLKPPLGAVDRLWAGSWGRVDALPSNNRGFPQSQCRLRGAGELRTSRGIGLDSLSD